MRSAPLTGFAFALFFGAILRLCGERSQASSDAWRSNLQPGFANFYARSLAKVWCWPAADLY